VSLFTIKVFTIKGQIRVSLGLDSVEHVSKRPHSLCLFLVSHFQRVDLQKRADTVARNPSGTSMACVCHPLG
jgi:hypothetical protein